MKFEILHQSKISRARVGRIHTAHGIIDTPNFVAVGTNGTIKSLDNLETASAGVQLMFCNTYHLLLQPGVDVIEKAGGLHEFIHRKLPIITDSGGFQVFSLAYGNVANELKSRGQKKVGDNVLKITEEGVLFRSYRDGAKILLTPESSIAAQKKLNSDIMIAFDELPPYHISKDKLKTSLDRTHRWELRSLEAHKKNPNNQALYAVIHGGIDFELRQKSCEYLTNLDFDGYAIGGSVGKNKEEMRAMLAFTSPYLPKEKPIHLLGIGDLASIDSSVPVGIDTFDSSYPTKAARHGIAFTRNGPLNITKSENALKFAPIDPDCGCSTCARFQCSYLHHLFKAKELSALSLMTLHNLFFMVNYMEQLRIKILNNKI